MIITITMKNVIKRDETYYFRISVPEDCRDSILRREITQSLKTKEPSIAAKEAKRLTAKWKKKFQEIRTGSSEDTPEAKSSADSTVADFEKQLADHMEQHLGDYLARQSDKELVGSSEWLLDCIFAVKKDDIGKRDLGDELGVTWPLPKQQLPGIDRKLKQALIDALTKIRKAIDKEAGWEISKKVEEDLLEPIPMASASTSSKPVAPEIQQADNDILKITVLMIQAKGTESKFAERIQAEVKCLVEWCNGKTDITQYTKADLVDYVQNCLVYTPKNMGRTAVYKGKSLKECVKMVRKDPDTYVPISYTTCKNDFIGVQSVFNYAKEDLGVIPINCARRIDIPKIRDVSRKDRAFTEDELSTIWNAIIPEALAKVDKYAERYWSTVLALYHGFRQNEICSLQVKNVYEDADGIFVIQITEDESVEGKRTKTVSSKRVVPVHPYVLNELDFRGYVEKRKNKAKEDGLLFPNVTFVKGGNFGKKVSVWFQKMKIKHLQDDAQHKNFHSLRHNFIQQAQNQAKMPDRYHQEIAGHAVDGLSTVHKNYSGSLRPRDVLEELSKLKYGWE